MAPLDPDALQGRARFLLEIDGLKSVERQTWLSDLSRRENSAEHSWHLAVAVMVLASTADDDIDLGRAVRMALVHDIVEVDAGDVNVYDTARRETQVEREIEAADRLFPIAVEAGADLRSLWDEFEAGETSEARFVRAVDRIQPLLLNHASGGRTWRANGIKPDQVRAVNSQIGRGSWTLWEYASALIDDAEQNGMFSAD